MNYTYLETVMRRTGIPAENIKSLLTSAKALSPETLAIMKEGYATYCADKDFDFKGTLQRVIESCTSEAENHAAQLIFSFMLTEQTEKYYQAAGLDMELYENMLQDLRVKNEECVRRFGYPGSFVAAWFYRWFSLQRFAFERLQMEVREIGVPYRHLSAESKAINVHIPACGPLDHDACLRDYKRAAEFFAAEFEGQDVAFMCHSWLLHPEHPNFLPETSRLLAFQGDFDIVRFDADPEGKDLWRLYGIPFDGNPEHLTERNSLERAYKQYLLDGGLSGEGLGVFLYKDI